MLPRVASRIALVGAVLSAGPTAFAQTEPIVDITVPPELVSALGTNADDLLNELETEIRALYGLLNVQEFLRLSANAQTLVSAGIGADYASNPKGFFAGFGVNATISTGEGDLITEGVDVTREVPTSAGAMLTLMAGYNFSEQGVDWLTLSLHGLHFPLNVAQLEGDFTNVGFRAQAKVLRQPNQDGVDAFRWGGIDFTTGFSYAQTRLTLVDDYRASTTISGGAILDTISTGTLVLRQTAYSIPLELTSNITLAEFFTLYGGFGVDIPLGDASVDMDLETQLEARIDGQTIPFDRPGFLRVRDTIDSDDILPRFLVGLQFNVWVIRIFAQLNIATQDSLIGLASGIRVTL